VIQRDRSTSHTGEVQSTRPSPVGRQTAEVAAGGIVVEIVDMVPNAPFWPVRTCFPRREAWHPAIDADSPLNMMQ
jgi:hypothetical protein